MVVVGVVQVERGEENTKHKNRTSHRWNIAQRPAITQKQIYLGMTRTGYHKGVEEEKARKKEEKTGNKRGPGSENKHQDALWYVCMWWEGKVCKMEGKRAREGRRRKARPSM